MPLRPEPDVRHAAWFTGAPGDWQTLATQGPPGFDAYATVWFDGPDVATHRSDDEVMELVVEVAAQHTRTPDDVFFGLWDGWGELSDPGRAYTFVRSHWLRDLWFRPFAPRATPAFGEAILDGPKVKIGEERAYLVFRGGARQVGDWGAAPHSTDIERPLAPASITWPADHAWFIAADVDASWSCVGGSQALIDALLAHPGLDAAPVVHGNAPALDQEEP